VANKHNASVATRNEQRVIGLTIIRLQLAIYFCLHRGKFAGKHGKLASSLSTTKDEIIAKFGLDAQISPIDKILAEAEQMRLAGGPPEDK
jgi:hypothetical protein